MDDDNDNIDWSLLARYFAAECASDEAMRVRRWIDADPARHARVRALREIWENAANLPSSSEIEDAWRRVASELEIELGAAAARSGDSRGPQRVPSRTTVLSLASAERSPRARRGWMRAAIAAGVLLAAGGPLLWWRAHRPAPPSMASAQPAMREFVTARGQRATITLLDGTRVELGVDSRLQVASFESGRREVYLNGEAAFSVVHDSARPFLVRAGNGVTEDLGTEFAVRAYPTDSQVTVVVVSGRVALRDDADSTRAPAVLDAGQLGRLDRDGRTQVTRGIDPSLYLAWTKGRLVFHDAMLRDVTTQLERWFDVEIRMSDPALAARRVTATVTVQSLDDVLAAVTFPLGIRYTRTGRVIELVGAPRGR